MPAKDQPAIKKELSKLSKALKEKRIAEGHTQESLAEKLDVSVETIHKIEINLRIPSLPMLLRIARAIGLKVSLE